MSSLRNFSQETLNGDNTAYAQRVYELHEDYGFDFVALGLAAFHGSPLHWIYSAGASGERYKRISLAPGHGIGGIVLKAGKPMLFTDIDRELDPREYSSYPIVFAEDLRSFLALPVQRHTRVVGVLLCAFRSTDPGHQQLYDRLCAELEGGLCDLGVITSDAFDFEEVAQASEEAAKEQYLGKSVVSKLIAAQEEERIRISRTLHDGIAQELLGVRFLLQRIILCQQGVGVCTESPADNAAQAQMVLDTVLDELHNISVELRPSTLDHFGLVSALRSQALVYRESYGVQVDFEVPEEMERMEPAYETQIYRIIQEALLNSCKSSGADRALVQINDAGSWIEARVVDHGEGFNVDAPVIRGSGCGLQGMRERAKIIGATLTFSSGESGPVVSLVAPTGRNAKKEEDAR